MKKLLFLTIVGLTAILAFGCAYNSPEMVNYDQGYANDSYEAENYECVECGFVFDFACTTEWLC